MSHFSIYLYCNHANLSELECNLFLQDASETVTEDQHTLELEALEDSGHLVPYKSTLQFSPPTKGAN